MKYLMLLSFSLLLYGCSTNQYTEISYGPFFKLEIPLQELSGAVFFQSDSVSVRFANGGVLSGLIIDKDIESLPAEFELSDYPKYSLGLESPAELREPYATMFANSWAETKRTYNDPQVTRSKTEQKSIYTACGQDSCLSFLVHKEMPEHILMLSGMNIDQTKFNELLRGIVNITHLEKGV